MVAIVRSWEGQFALDIIRLWLSLHASGRKKIGGQKLPKPEYKSGVKGSGEGQEMGLTRPMSREIDTLHLNSTCQRQILDSFPPKSNKQENAFFLKEN